MRGRLDLHGNRVTVADAILDQQCIRAVLRQDGGQWRASDPDWSRNHLDKSNRTGEEERRDT